MADIEPNPKDQSNTGAISDHMKEHLTRLWADVERDNDDRAEWLQKMVIATNQRLGVKSYSDYPYPGAPDYPLPETDKLIKKQVPNLVLSAWSAKTMCSVTVEPGREPNPEWEEKAKKTEKAMNQLLRGPKLNWFKKLYCAADYAKQHGHCLFRIREEFQSHMVHKVLNLEDYDPEVIDGLRDLNNEGLRKFLSDRYGLDEEDDEDLAIMDDIIKQFRDGKEVIDFELEMIESFPNVDVPLPTKVIVPPYASNDLDRLPRLTYEYFLTRYELELLMEQKIFRQIDLDTLSLTTHDDDDVETQKNRNEGITPEAATSDIYRIHETTTFYREKKGAPLRRWVFTRLADSGSVEEGLLADLEFPFEFKGINWEKFDIEVKDDRYYSSRGTPEQIRAYQDILERALNNMLIRDEMNNTPMWEVLNTSELLDDHIRFVPGQKLPVKALGSEIAQLGSQAIPDMSSGNIMQITKGYVEEYQSSNDYLFRNATNAGGGKTLGEINVGMQHNSGPVNLEIIAWNECLSRVYQKMFEILKERMGESIWIDGMEITREDFNFPAVVKSNGELEIADQATMTQKAFQRVQVLTNPNLSDIVDGHDRYEIVKDWIEKDGVKDPDKFVTNPEEIATTKLANLQQQIAAAEAQLGKIQQESEEAYKESEKAKKSKSKAELDKEVEDEIAAEEEVGTDE